MRAAVLSLVLLVFAVALVAAEHVARGRGRRLAGGRRGAATGAAQPARPVESGGTAGAGDRAGHRGRGADGHAGGRGSRRAGPRWDAAQWLAALGSTLRLSVAAALASTAAALPLGVLAARHRDRATRTLEGVSYVAHGLPAVVIAISMVSLGVALLRPIYQREPLLILGLHRAVRTAGDRLGAAAVESAPIRLEEVARSLGRTPLRAFAAATARVAWPGIAAGTAMVLLTCMKELPVTLLLHPTGTDTLATRLWGFSSVSDYAAAAPYAAALLVFAAVPTAVLGLWSTPADGVRDE